LVRFAGVCGVYKARQNSALVIPLFVFFVACTRLVWPAPLLSWLYRVPLPRRVLGVSGLAGLGAWLVARGWPTLSDLVWSFLFFSSVLLSWLPYRSGVACVSSLSRLFIALWFV
jgi:hypothetical protein